MRKYNQYFSALSLAAILFASCDKDDNNNPEPVDPTVESKYIVAVTPAALTNVADYLLTADNLDAGTISTTGNGVEQDGTYRYYVTHNGKFFSMLYGQGNPGAVTAYDLATGKLNKLTNFQTETVQAFAPADKDILMFKIPRSQTGGNNALWYRVSTEKLEIVGEGQTDIVSMASNGERAHFTWLKQVGNKVYAPYMSIKGCCSDNFGTAYPDSAWIAVFSYPSMTLEKVIKDNRTSFIGRYFTDGLEVVENGDVYAFSSGVATNVGVYTSTKHSAITRLKSGITEFDQTYLFDIETASGGWYLTNKLYVGNNTFILSMAKDKGAYAIGNRFAIVNVVDKTFKWVEGTPDPKDIADVTTTNFAPMDNKTGYIGISLNDGKSAVYKFDASTATAVKGLNVEGGGITAIQKLSKSK
ncbi:DUF4374 domain-containing protein [Pseudobacter ginsenosidimutans]|jgi:hypothetical protein|uniref:Uncharacterized protein DUF4374 n=1 Tax=Pseudobacter ginsenosidimutans TaxID=661488 RepID=A0A4Q7N0T6_9BACT|nr:DUF4374 domain-containing protein [Pseudobacter ginsenosidimutans]QEC42858.1 DUF4374 domain-containing protein [Pseudobacter ginsenosidimutans]RZS74209.1 uncharacterized protein DUF4374 [Pseudobacter ginsenosidimutans]